MVIRLALWILVGSLQCLSVIFMASYQGYILSTRFTTVAIGLDRMVQVLVVFFIFLHCKFIPSPELSTLDSLERSHPLCAAHT